MKATKAEADYGPGKKSEHCRICEHWRQGACTKVQGQIDPDAWCKYWKAKT